MRREPGEPLRHELHEREKRAQRAISLARLDGSMYIGCGIGFAIAALAPVVVPYLVGRPLHVWGFVLALAAAAVLSVAWGCIVGRKGSRPKTNDHRRTKDIEKGERAEKRIGQAIDYAIAAPGCAAAHGVTKIAKYGDIDHIVLTPARLWVVETKSGRVPGKEFQKALGQIAANVKAARKWMPNAEVQGCLALASGDVTERDEKGYEAKGETVMVKDRESLWRTMRAEARTLHAVDNADAQKVWALGKREE